MVETVLVTGGTGYIGATILIKLIQDGKYNIRTTVRSKSKTEYLYKLIQNNIAKITIPEIESKLTVYEADLNKDEGWDKAIKGSDFVLHVASPVAEPKDVNEAIIPARDGTLRVTKLSHKYGVKKIVFTSSFATVGYGHKTFKSSYDESDYSPLETTTGAYAKSKIEAERVFWKYINSDENTKSAHPLIGTALLPTAIFGPPPKGMSIHTTIEIGARLVNGSFKYGVPRLYLGIVDVREVADLHIASITNKASDGERIILVSQKERTDLLRIAKMVKDVPGVKQGNLPTRFLPSWLFRTIAIFVPPLRAITPLLDIDFEILNTKAVTIFNWKPNSVKQTSIDMVKAIVEHEANK